MIAQTVTCYLLVQSIKAMLGKYVYVFKSVQLEYKARFEFIGPWCRFKQALPVLNYIAHHSLFACTSLGFQVIRNLQWAHSLQFLSPQWE